MARILRRPAARSERASSRKGRLTLSLGEETIRFLHEHQTEAKAPSLSASVESLVADYRRKLEAEELSMQTLAYYDGVSDEERAESAGWGQMAEREFIDSEK